MSSSWLRDMFHVNPRQMRRLSTHEDRHYFHAHKVLGILVMSNFVYRVYLMVTARDIGLDAAHGDILAWLVVHALLHVSSFQFILSARRNTTYNIIWPEMRWHSMIFAFRSIAMLLVMWLHARGVVPREVVNAARPAIVLGTMALADCATRHYKRIGQVAANDSTMRGNPYPAYVSPTVARVLNLFYALSQVMATMAILSTGNMGPVFMLLIPIQTAPFCMTLVKKGIISQGGWHLYYTGALLLNYVYPHVVKNVGTNVIPETAYWSALALFVVGRFALRMNKYVLWLPIILLFSMFYFPSFFYFADPPALSSPWFFTLTGNGRERAA
jgi:hypothetical protein